MKIMLSANWCIPCRQLKSQIENSNLDIEIVDIETDRGCELVDQYNVKHIPAFIIDGELVTSYNI